AQKLGKDEGTSFAFDLHAARFFDEVQFVIDLDFIQRYSKRFISHAFLQIRDVKRTMNSTQLLWEFKTIGNGSYFVNDLKRS
ncbi:hypothetical protein Tco_0342852, partial [Tanacetum coccineum]